MAEGPRAGRSRRAQLLAEERGCSSQGTGKSMKEIFIFLSSPKGVFSITLREKGREREKHQCERETSIGCLPYMPGWGGWTHNPGMFPDHELNPQRFSYGTILQPAEPHWPG